MKKNKNNTEEELASSDLMSASLISVVFIASMFLLTGIFTPLVSYNPYANDVSQEHAQEQSNDVLNELIRIADNENSFTCPQNTPEGSKQLFSRPRASLIKLPPFKGKKGEHVYHPFIKKASREQNLDPALVKAVIMAESSYNPQAVSPRGAIGLMQLMPQTAKSLGVKNSFSPEQNIQGGTKYLRNLIDRLDGDISMALAAYNSGLTHVLRYNGIPPFKETEQYLHKVYHYYDFYKNQVSNQAHKNPNSEIIGQSIEEEA